MAYPFMPGLTWEAVLATLSAHGIKLVEKNVKFNGTFKTVQYLERSFGDEVLQQPVDVVRDQRFLMPSTLRAICKGLKVPGKVLGLDLG